jgi:hypothetical protein
VSRHEYQIHAIATSQFENGVPGSLSLSGTLLRRRLQSRAFEGFEPLCHTSGACLPGIRWSSGFAVWRLRMLLLEAFLDLEKPSIRVEALRKRCGMVG